MAIYNPDGSPYKPSGSLRQYKPQSGEHDLFNRWDKEAIEIGGTPIYYYEVFIQSNTVDPLYWEDRGKIFCDSPITLYAYYDPFASQNLMGTFGIDAPDEIMFELNYQDVLNKIGHPPKVGSRIFTPHKKENWCIKQRNTEVYKLWGTLRLQLICEKFQESRTTGNGEVTKKEPKFKID